MSFLSFLNFFSLYEGPFEKQVDRFLKGLKRKSKADLEGLIQTDLVRLSIFLEYKFKGYKKLKRRYRKKLYRNAEAIKIDFKDFIRTHEAKILQQKKSLKLSPALMDDQHFDYLLLIMAYLKPGRIFDYQPSATFEKLLRDPKDQKLQGDCNQLVTLYIYLFALKYGVGLLQVKILPEHICLHYKGQDIETTTGQLADYPAYTFLSEVTEIVPANVLDIDDPSETQFNINPHTIFQAAELAYRFSSHRATVEKNLFIAYKNLAIFYAQKKNFKKAKTFANRSGDTRLQDHMLRLEAAQLLKDKKYHKALANFRHLNDIQGEKACFQHELSDLTQKMKGLKTIEQYKKVKPTLRRMKDLALRLNNQNIVNFVDDVFSHF